MEKHHVQSLTLYTRCSKRKNINSTKRPGHRSSDLEIFSHATQHNTGDKLSCITCTQNDCFQEPVTEILRPLGQLFDVLVKGSSNLNT